MKQVFDNAVILYGEELEEVHGYIVVKDGVIEDVGEGSYVGPKKDVKRGIVSPSFTNAHVHIGDSSGMDMGAYLPISDRVGKQGMKYDIHKRPDARSAIAKSLSSMWKSGTTAFCDFREGGVEGIRLLKSLLNMPARILGRPMGDENIMEYCDGLGISSIRDYDGEKLKGMLADRGGKLVGIHAGESSDDVLEALKIQPDFLIHLTNASEKSLKIVFRQKKPIVLCPRANAAFGVGIPDLKSILNSGCLIALGTDNVMANSTNILRETEFLWKLYRGLYRDHRFDSRTVLKVATINGRRLLNLPDNAIKEGNRADFIITKRPGYAHDPVLALIHRAETHDIKDIIAPSFMPH
jgi:cytosine/adenosine deaminase-related metal-dependent hydrolase